MRWSSSTRLREIRRTVPAVAGLVLLPALMACMDEEVRERPLHEGPVEPGERTWLPAEWDTLWALGGPDDETLQLPMRLRPHSEGLVVWDQGRWQVLSFDETGELEWSFGSEGQGPDEFQDVPDLQVTPEGRTFVYDHGNQRVTILDREGAVEKRVGLADVPRSNTLAIPGDSLLVFVSLSGPDDPLWAVDLEGEVVHRGNLPWEGFNDLSAISRQGNVHSRGDRWAYAFLLTNGWFGFQALEPLEHLGGFVEHQGLPGVAERSGGGERTQRLTERPTCTACSLSITDSVLAVHFGGHQERAARTLDLHRWENGEYLGSWELPEPAREAMLDGRRAYSLRADPFPVITAFRRVESDD